MNLKIKSNPFFIAYFITHAKHVRYSGDPNTEHKVHKKSEQSIVQFPDDFCIQNMDKMYAIVP